MGRRKTRVLAGVVVLALGALLIVWKTRGAASDTEDTSTTVDTPAPATRATTAARTASPPKAPAPAARAPAVDQPQPVPVDPSAHPPSLEAPVSKPAPPQVPFTREETIAKREADLELLDDARARLESDLATATAEVASELQIRIARLGALRKQRVTELDQIRAGGALPP